MLLLLTRYANRDLIKRYQHDPNIHRSISTQSTTSDRTWEVYADNSVLDFNLPHTITSASLAPLAQQKTQQDASNKYLRWIVNHLWPVRQHQSRSPSSDLPHTAIQVEKAYPQRPAPAATKADDMKQNATNYSSSIPTLLHSPTAYLIGASESDTMVDDRDILKDIVLEQPLRSRSNHPSSSILSAPIFLEDQLDEAVPWRVLEATGDDDMTKPTGSSSSNTSQHQTQEPAPPLTCATASQSLSLQSDHEVDSWLELNDDPPSPSSRMSQWFTRRGDSFEIVRERVARSSKSIRRWCRQQQQLQQSNTATTIEERGDYYYSSSCEVLTNNENPSRLSSSSSTEQQQQQRGGGGSLDLRWSRTLSGSFFDPTALQAVPEETADTTRSRETQKRRNS